MTKRNIMPRIIYVGLAAALALSACGGDDKVEQKPQSDAGVGGGGTLSDSGVDSRPDSGIGRADGGTTQPDSGVPACTQDSECASGESCVGGDAMGNGVLCNGAADCVCLVACDFTKLTEGCPTGGLCVFVGEASTIPGRGVCVPSSGRTTEQGAACTMTFNADGTYQSDTCEDGVICRGPLGPNAPAGECVRLCDPAQPAGCTALGAYVCSADEGATAGLCLSPPATVADLGEACTAGTTCEGGACIDLSFNATPALACTSSCGNTDQCPANTFCGANACIASCTPGGAAQCAGNATLACHPVSATQGICLGKCATTADCAGFGAASTCTVATGICN